jgi:hypothetical protein
MTVDDDLRVIGMIRTLLSKLELDHASFEAAIALRTPKARRMGDEIRDALRTRIELSAASRNEQSASEAGNVAVRSAEAIQMALEKKPEARPLVEALRQAKDDLKKWEDQVLKLKKNSSSNGFR